MAGGLVAPTEDFHKLGAIAEFVRALIRERTVAHVDNDTVRRAYARADYWNERVRMMSWWADRCDELRSGIGFPCKPDNAPHYRYSGLEP
jgi:hypothetical protein